MTKQKFLQLIQIFTTLMCCAVLIGINIVVSPSTDTNISVEHPTDSEYDNGSNPCLPLDDNKPWIENPE